MPCSSCGYSSSDPIYINVDSWKRWRRTLYEDGGRLLVHESMPDDCVAGMYDQLLRCDRINISYDVCGRVMTVCGPECDREKKPYDTYHVRSEELSTFGKYYDAEDGWRIAYDRTPEKTASGTDVVTEESDDEDDIMYVQAPYWLVHEDYDTQDRKAYRNLWRYYYGDTKRPPPPDFARELIETVFHPDRVRRFQRTFGDDYLDFL